MPVIGLLWLAGACAGQPPATDGDGGGNGGGLATTTDEGAGNACGTPTPASAWAMWRMPNPSMDDLPNQADYTDLGDGTARDNVTCLVWQRDISGGTYTWADADTYCMNLKLAGGGWRLPTRIELVSLVDFSKPSPGPTIDTDAFPDTPAEAFWSSSLVPGWDFAWYVNFYTGATSNELFALAGRARCVR